MLDTVAGNNVKGIYTLLLEHHGVLEVGALGLLEFDGLYLYGGSAFGAAGLARVSRHLQVHRGERTTLKWHIDYLLGVGRWHGAYRKEAGPEGECSLAKALAAYGLVTIPRFGSSDCRCAGHLFQIETLEQAHELLEKLGLQQWEKAD